MLTNLLNWFKPTITQETEESVLVKHAIENNQIEIEENDAIIFDKGLAGYGPYGQRQEALVLDYTDEDVKVAYTIKTNQKTPWLTLTTTSTNLEDQVINQVKITKKTRWIPLYSITSNLGEDYWSTEELLSMGLIDPKPQRTPNKPLLSGTYIEESEGEFFLKEIEKVNGVYYIHDVSSSICWKIDQDHEYDLHEFSAPEEGTYILDPGVYIDTDQMLMEVVPFQGACWVRDMSDSTLTKLTEKDALKLTRVETDEPTPGFYIIDPIDDPEETPEYDDHLEPYKVPEQKTQENCGCYGCAGEINTEDQPGFTPRRETSILDLVHYDDSEVSPPEPYTPGISEAHPTDPI